MAYEINTGVGWLVLELVTETAIVNIGIGVQILASFRWKLQLLFNVATKNRSCN